MTERTYGRLTMDQWLNNGCAMPNSAIADAFAHIRELQAEVAELKRTIAEVQFEENKADRRKFAMNVVNLAVDAAICAERGGIAPSIEAIVEQELNK